ncbi:hypothetical protein DPX16_22821 [Anabarilius grahami]|uniref:Uncharacterized protein n=1 Tax=Anabarilius grahami TaxID=495550 RepID=A0A3N0ZA84_ANAGA|nr:hypothetical protein DPX16_22821 [Anabarilius grahami]
MLQICTKSLKDFGATSHSSSTARYRSKQQSSVQAGWVRGSHLRKSTAAANESRHRLNYDQWTETSEPVSVEEPKSVDHPSSSQASPTELRTAKQTLSTGQYTTRRGRVVKPPDRLCL